MANTTSNASTFKIVASVIVVLLLGAAAMVFLQSREGGGSSAELAALSQAMPSQAERALRLCGAATRLREDIGAPLPPAAQAKLGRTLTLARNTLEESKASSALTEGRAMSLEQAIEYAFEGS